MAYLTFWIQAEFVTSIPQILRFLSFSVIVVLLEENPNLKETALIFVSRKKCGCSFVYRYLLWEKVNITQLNHFFYNQDWFLAGIYLTAMKMQALETSCCLAGWPDGWLSCTHQGFIDMLTLMCITWKQQNDKVRKPFPFAGKFYIKCCIVASFLQAEDFVCWPTNLSQNKQLETILY